MPKCCAYGIPNDPEGNVIRWVICADENQPCPQFAALKNMGSWAVASCSNCAVPVPKPKFRCCTYALRSDPSGNVVRWSICLPEKVRCPKIPGYKSVGSKLVTSCKNCCGVSRQFPLKPQLKAKLLAAVRKGKKPKRARRTR